MTQRLRISRCAVGKLETHKRGLCSSNLNPKAWEVGESKGWVLAQWQENTDFLAQAFLFYSGPQLIGQSTSTLGRVSLLSLPNQILIFPRNTLIDTPRNNVLPAFLVSLSSGKLTYKIDHHFDEEQQKIHPYCPPSPHSHLAPSRATLSWLIW